MSKKNNKKKIGESGARRGRKRESRLEIRKKRAAFRRVKKGSQ